ncbi:hypothetical protein C351_05560 [Cryptococcus neoformans c8]|nr:hypothetical protein C351_05560 [Cryptococcus neoformans var. grubii c8]OXH03953.1 hypothetical protein C369_05839 [Cryptococcus neoformans var. grubii A5-35-17]
MNGRKNYQTCAVQEVNHKTSYPTKSTFPGIELTQFPNNMITETSTVVSIVVDLPQKRIITYMAFSRGHWDYPEKAHVSSLVLHHQ